MLVTWCVDGALIGSVTGELVDAVPMLHGASDEVVLFRVGESAIFVLDRESFRGWRSHLDGDRTDGLDLQLAGGTEVKLISFTALGLA